MIETPSGWIHEEDLTRAEVLDRRDSFELRQACVAYLKSHHTLTRPKSIGAASDRNVQKALVQASIRRLVGIRARDSALHSLLSQREGVIEEQSKTIDRLLAYIPARAAPLSDQRLQEISGYVSDFLTKRDLSANVHVVDETGPDTLACHRLTVMLDKADIRPISQIEDELFDLLAEIAEPEEAPSLNLTVASEAEQDGPAA